MIKGAIIGLGKMGLSHVSIVNAHPDVEVVAVCDTSSLVLDVFRKFSRIKTYTDYNKLFEDEKLDFVVIAVPTVLHFQVAKAAFERNIHVFCEKPLALLSAEIQELVRLATEKNLVNQVGFHNHFIGTFMQLKKLLKADILGKLFHFSGEAYGPVMLSRENSTWRSKREQGGGCLYDYAAHVINLLQEVVARPTKIHGALLKKTFSTEVEDAVYALLGLENGVTGTLLVNWSDDTYRKMSTSITVMGEKGKMVCDATELKIFLKEANREFGFEQGWTIKTIADLALPVNFYLRGEEYSAQIDYFVDCVKNNHRQEINTFEQSQFTNHVIDMIIQNSTEN